MIATGANNNLADAHTDGSGHYSLEAWPDEYRVSVYPPPGSSDGFASKPGVIVAEGGSAGADLHLPAERGSGHVSGNAFYADHAADAGVQVSVSEERFESGVINNATVYTDEAGNWDAGSLPAGLYRLSYSALGGGSNLAYPESHLLASERIVVESGSYQVFSQELSGQKPLGSLIVHVRAAEGWPAAGGSLHIGAVGGGPAADTDYGSSGFRFPALPAGTYNLSASGGQFEDDGSGNASASVSDGHLSSVEIQLPANPVPAGTAASNEQQELAWLNAQRSQWGLPAGLISVPVWSQACAAHDAYGAINHVLEHPEDPGKPGHSVGGQWAGEHAILAADSSWGPGNNPWNDAPIHLNQLMTPSLSAVGIDDSRNHQCVTTWPGMLRSEEAGKVYTYPGNGSSGIPPVELAAESPTTPNEVLGVPDLAGRQLFVYETGTETFSQGFEGIQVRSASLTSPSGSVPIKVADGGSSIGGYLTGAIIVPVQPLAPFTTYQATVTLAPVSDFRESRILPQITHSWSFTTGHNNPNGYWDEPKPKPAKQAKPRRTVVVRWRKRHIIVKGWHFKRGRVVIKRKVLLKRKRRLNGKIVARAHVSAKGKFVARFRWPEKRHIALRVYQNGKSTAGIYTPPHPPGWYRRHHHRHRHSPLLSIWSDH